MQRLCKSLFEARRGLKSLRREMFIITVDVARIILILGGIGILVAALCNERVCGRLLRLLGVLTKVLGALIKLRDRWGK
jgi:hypothetical protein